MQGAKRWLGVAIGVLVWHSAHGWGPDGHHTVAAIAAELVAGSNAATQVQTILGDISLTDAAVWPDCAKGVNPTTFKYKVNPRYKECAIFETPDGEAAMEDFVRRNSTNCIIKPDEEICHKQYHYSDVAVQHGKYQSGWVGTRDDDIVAAVIATIEVLKGNAAPAPFSIKDKKEALSLLAHYAGDIHQPLHVGAVYLDTQGKRVNPDTGTFDPKTETRGGNKIVVVTSTGKIGKDLHSTWDAIPASLKMAHVNDAWLSSARGIAKSTGSDPDWPAQWASDTVAEAQKAFTGLTFGPFAGNHWTVTLPSGYSGKMSTIKKRQLTRAGAHLAQLLEDIWP